MRQTEERYNDKLTFKYVEIAKFSKSIGELSSNFDKWLYVLRNLARLDNQPEYLRNEVFNRLFKEADISPFEWRHSAERYCSGELTRSK